DESRRTSLCLSAATAGFPPPPSKPSARSARRSIRQERWREPERQKKESGMKRVLDIALPLIVAILVLGAWEWAVAHWQVPVYVLPGPSAIATAFADNFWSLMAAWLTTLTVTSLAFVAATITGLGFAVLFAESRLAERTLYPYAITIQ